jgi:hypothetical protein
MRQGQITLRVESISKNTQHAKIRVKKSKKTVMMFHSKRPHQFKITPQKTRRRISEWLVSFTILKEIYHRARQENQLDNSFETYRPSK